MRRITAFGLLGTLSDEGARAALRLL